MSRWNDKTAMWEPTWEESEKLRWARSSLVISRISNTLISSNNMIFACSSVKVIATFQDLCFNVYNGIKKFFIEML